MNTEFTEWLKQNRYTHLTATRDGHIWMVNESGVWKWDQIKDYEY